MVSGQTRDCITLVPSRPVLRQPARAGGRPLCEFAATLSRAHGFKHSDTLLKWEKLEFSCHNETTGGLRLEAWEYYLTSPARKPSSFRAWAAFVPHRPVDSFYKEFPVVLELHGISSVL